MLLRAVDVLDIYVEPFIHSGFRLPNQPYSYYFRLLFFLHNETFSIWIHLLGTVVLLHQVFEHISQLSIDFYSSTFSFYIIYNCIGACLMLLCSAQAHLFHSRTLADHLRSFYLDYFGINFYGVTSGVILYKFSHPQKVSTVDHLNNERSYYLTLSLLSLYSISIACFCKTFYRRPYPFSHKLFQCSGVLILYLYQIWPVLRNLFFTYLFSGKYRTLVKGEEKALFWHLIQFLSFLLSGLIFIGRFPERLSPGLFDLFGQSHHAFHLTIFLMAYSQANAVLEDMRSLSSNEFEHNLMKDIFYTLVVLILQLIAISLWYRKSRPTMEQRYKIDLQQSKFHH